MSTPSFVVCIDESGDQGLSFDSSGTSKWFVLSAVVGLESKSEEIHTLVKHIKSRIGWHEPKPLHFTRVKGDNRRIVVEEMVAGKALFRGITVMVHKPSLTNSESFREENRLYMYYTRYLLERVSWLCRDCKEGRQKQYGDGTAKLIFSSMNELSKARLEGYIQTLKTQTTAIAWSSLRDEIHSLSPGKHAGLQLADVMAGSFYCADHQCEKHKTDGWAEMLKPVMFRSRRGQYRGYGLKLCPMENETAQSALAPWAARFYP